MKTYPIVLYHSKSRAIRVIKRTLCEWVPKAKNRKKMFYSLIMLFSFFLGLSPIFFNFVIDPYNMNKVFDLDIPKEKISLKAHYPLWKILNYPRESASTLILGDSRALALKDKYWHQLKYTQAYNFAYGGATISEIYDTYKYVKNDPNLKTLVIGIQLRSFSPLFKKGMNRVPEAIKLAHNPLKYYSNGFVTRVSWKHFGNRYNDQLQAFNEKTLNVSLFAKANAASSTDTVNAPLEQLLDPSYCTNCILPEITEPAPLPAKVLLNSRLPLNLGIWQPLWPTVPMTRSLPNTFEKQVIKNAKSDWQTFTFSQSYWNHLREIASWSDANGVKLVFFVPPTIQEMQQQITNYGFADLNQTLREDLARLAPVVDFDYPNSLTQDLKNFNDAYHFNHKAAKAIIGELVQFLSEDAETTKLARKRRSSIQCPIKTGDFKKIWSENNLKVIEGHSCRIWRSTHG